MGKGGKKDAKEDGAVKDDKGKGSCVVAGGPITPEKVEEKEEEGPKCQGPEKESSAAEVNDDPDEERLTVNEDAILEEIPEAKVVEEEEKVEEKEMEREEEEEEE